MLAFPRSSQVAKFQPLWAGQVNPNASCDETPEEYSGVHDIPNVRDLRPWFFAPAPPSATGDPAAAAPTTPALSPLPTAMYAKTVYDRKPMPGRRPGVLLPDYSNVRARYLVELSDAPRPRWMREPDAAFLAGGPEAIRAFERRYPRTAERVCARVRDYPAKIPLESGDEGVLPTVTDVM